jgi:hypothetical protein
MQPRWKHFEDSYLANGPYLVYLLYELPHSRICEICSPHKASISIQCQKLDRILMLFSLLKWIKRDNYGETVSISLSASSNVFNRFKLNLVLEVWLNGRKILSSGI